MAKTLIKNIKTIVGISTEPLPFKKGEAQSHLETMDQAYLVIKDDLIYHFGAMQELQDESDYDTIIDACQGLVLPSWCDSHTHIVFAASREREFEMKIQGMSYEEIAAQGGGILNSAHRLRKTSEDDLYHMAMARLQEVISYGTGAIEIKSGYGLSVDSELKMLRVIKRLKTDALVTIKASFLGAHAIPTEYKSRRDYYIDLIIDEMLPRVAEEGLANYIDVFCEQGFFTVEETDKILKAGARYGLPPKIHANQLSNSGGVQVGVANQAISVDHLEVIGPEEIEVLVQSGTIPTALPSCSYYLNIPYAPVRKMIAAGLGVALATDFNPGSSPSGNIPFLLSLACTKMKMTPAEAFNAVTINGAHAMEIADLHGSITPGKVANVIITKDIPNLSYIPYMFGTNHISEVMLRGQLMS